MNIWKWEGWTAISALTQILLSFAAFITIIYTLHKDRDFTDPKLKLNYKMGLGVMEYTENDSTVRKIFEGCTIYIVNEGFSPIYITDCGVCFEDVNDVSGIATLMEEDVLKINVGELKKISLCDPKMIFPLIEKEVSSSAQMYLTAETATGKKIKVRTEHNYGSFKNEYERWVRKAEESNSRSPINYPF